MNKRSQYLNRKFQKDKLTFGNGHLSLVQGFTLIELLVVMVLLSLIGLAFLGLQYIFTQNQVTAWENYLNIDEANRIISEMVREVRNAQESDRGDYPLVSLNDQELIFYSDFDFDSDVERIRYTLAGSSFSKGIIEPIGSPIDYPLASEQVVVLTTNVRNGVNPVFFYYNEDWPIDTVNNPLIPADRLSDTRLIKINLRFNPDESDSSSDYILESDAKIRNIN